MVFSARAATKDVARSWRRRTCTSPRSSSTLPRFATEARVGIPGAGAVVGQMRTPGSSAATSCTDVRGGFSISRAAIPSGHSVQAAFGGFAGLDGRPRAHGWVCRSR
jgi:hypothetical protein